MNNKFSKSQYLKSEFNGFWKTILGEERDYFSLMTGDSFDVLKAALSNINNIITLNTTVNAIDVIGNILNLNSEDKEEIFRLVDSTKPNDNGYDIEYRDGETPFICEVKCNRPINGGNRFGSAQKNGITKDLNMLLHGKSKSSLSKEDIEGYFKFMVIYKFDDNTVQAVEHFHKLLKGELKTSVKIYKPEMNIIEDEVYLLLV